LTPLSFFWMVATKKESGVKPPHSKVSAQVSDDDQAHLSLPERRIDHPLCGDRDSEN
jgi:hypothetical protein